VCTASHEPDVGGDRPRAARLGEGSTGILSVLLPSGLTTLISSSELLADDSADNKPPMDGLGSWSNVVSSGLCGLGLMGLPTILRGTR
jgi:hypothetical protein